MVTVVDGHEVSNIKQLVRDMHHARASSHPFPPLERAEEDQWCEWAEKVLHPNVEINLFRSPADSKQSMESVIERMGMTGMNSTLLRNVGSLYLYMVS